MIRFIYILIFMLLSSSSTVCETTGYVFPRRGEYVPYCRLVANPDQFEGKRIRVMGYLTIAVGHGYFLSSSKELSERDLFTYGLRLSFHKSPDGGYDILFYRENGGLEEISKYNEKYVIVEGVYEATSKDFVVDTYDGFFTDINYVDYASLYDCDNVIEE